VGAYSSLRKPKRSAGATSDFQPVAWFWCAWYICMMPAAFRLKGADSGCCGCCCMTWTEGIMEPLGTMAWWKP
jgi:hypothetical protein